MAFFLMLVFLISTTVIPLRGQQGFVSIDCGYNGDSYSDGTTKLTYVSDEKYIDTGKTYSVPSDYTSDQPMQTQYLRSFPEGDRNCYTIDGMNQGAKYLIRASFLYGNYDRKSTTGITFDLYLGVNFWQTITITFSSRLYMAEVITVASANYTSVCLVNTKLGVPFISALELRLIDNNNMFKDIDQSVSLIFPERYSLGAPDNALIRYPDDKYDRTWRPCNAYCGSLETIKTTSVVKQDEGDPYDVPSKVIQAAGASISNTLSYYFDSPNTRSIYPTSYIYLHFAELLSLNSTESRLFQVSLTGHSDIYNCSPTYLVATHISFKYVVRTVQERRYLYLTRLSGSTHRPLLNAIEFYTTISLPNLATEQGEVGAMREIKKLYQIKEWQGDPCVPTNFTWRGINCTVTDSNPPNPPRVTALILSSRGLTGEIPGALAKLTALQELDLSTNNLQGPIPEFLAGMSSLRLLKLSWNNVSGVIPAALLERQKSGSLTLGLEHNSLLCYPWDPCAGQQQQQTEKEKKKPWIILVASIVPGVVILASIVSLTIWLRRRNGRPQPPRGGMTPGEAKRILPEIRRFSYLEVESITNNFKKVIGKGGFGIVYYGVLEDKTTEVAVKVRGQASEQGTQEFNAETDILSTAKHMNLLSLVGYCEEGNHLALIYPYMANGSLRDHLFDGHAMVLSWAQRLKIATEAAQGLDFLHTGCERPIVHRDVKPHNILLTQKWEAKISDVGMSKPLPVDKAQSFIEASKIVGTFSYLDPEYLVSSRLNEKSDVYSFGVVLLELITCVQAFGERDSIVEWVGNKYDGKRIASIVDTKLHGEYEPKSIQEVLEVAMRCTMRLPSRRPAMKEVVSLLEKSLEVEVARGRGKNDIFGEFSTGMSQSDSIEMVRTQGNMSVPAAR